MTILESRIHKKREDLNLKVPYYTFIHYLAKDVHYILPLFLPTALNLAAIFVHFHITITQPELM